MLLLYSIIELRSSVFLVLLTRIELVITLYQSVSMPFTYRRCVYGDTKLTVTEVATALISKSLSYLDLYAFM